MKKQLQNFVTLLLKIWQKKLFQNIFLTLRSILDLQISPQNRNNVIHLFLLYSQSDLPKQTNRNNVQTNVAYEYEGQMD